MDPSPPFRILIPTLFFFCCGQLHYLTCEEYNQEGKSEHLRIHDDTDEICTVLFLFKSFN